MNNPKTLHVGNDPKFFTMAGEMISRLTILDRQRKQDSIPADAGGTDCYLLEARYFDTCSPDQGTKAIAYVARLVQDAAVAHGHFTHEEVEKHMYVATDKDKDGRITAYRFVVPHGLQLDMPRVQKLSEFIRGSVVNSLPIQDVTLVESHFPELQIMVMRNLAKFHGIEEDPMDQENPGLFRLSPEKSINVLAIKKDVMEQILKCEGLARGHSLAN